MTSLSEQFSAARHSQVEAQLAFLRSLTSKTVESAEKIMALNLRTSRASVEKSAAALRQWAGIEDPRDLFSLTHQTQEYFDGMLAYGRQLFSIASSLQAGLVKPAAAAPALPAPALPAPALAVAVAPAPVPAPAPAARAVKPARKPLVAVQPAASPKPIAKTKPVAKAVKKVAAKAPRPAAAPFPTAALMDKKK